MVTRLEQVRALVAAETDADHLIPTEYARWLVTLAEATARCESFLRFPASAGLDWPDREKAGVAWQALAPLLEEVDR